LSSFSYDLQQPTKVGIGILVLYLEALTLV